MMHADASDRQHHDHDGAPGAGDDVSWMYRSEAFAEDLDEAPRVSAVAAPGKRGGTARPVRAVLRSLGGRLSPGLAG